VSETGGATVAAPSIAAALARYYAALVQGGLPDATANQIVLDAAIRLHSSDMYFGLEDLR
jgi:hypothetical protein